MRACAERTELCNGLSVAGYDGNESDADERNPQWRRPFKSKYSIFYPKMCEPENQENTSQVLDSQGMDHMNSQGIDQKEQLTDEDLIQEKVCKNPKEDDKDQGPRDHSDHIFSIPRLALGLMFGLDSEDLVC